MSVWQIQLRGAQGDSVIDGGAGALALLAGPAREAVAEGRRLFVITDENVHREWGRSLQGMPGLAPQEGRVLVLTPGEQTKRPEIAGRCWDWLVNSGADRQDIVVALGGGVVGDLAGFVAATYLRGVTLWQVPTSLLAQVDSSVGGKNGVNLPAGKNLVGTFYQPGRVIIDPEVLSTLPEDEYTGGLGEVVKYALLGGEADLAFLEAGAEAIRGRDPQILSAVIRRCVQQKADVVEEDELDRGGRAVLNLGHTTGHALEQILGYGTISHGVAVGLGILVALALSEEESGLDRSVLRRTRMLMESLRLPTRIEVPPTEQMLQVISRDKKAVSGRARFVGLAALGAPVAGLEVTDERLVAALEVIRA